MYECEAENQLKVSKAFLNIDGKDNSNEKSILFSSYSFDLIETIVYNITTTATSMILSGKYHRTSSPSYGRFEKHLANGKKISFVRQLNARKEMTDWSY